MLPQPKILSKEIYDKVISLIDKSIDECLLEIFQNPFISDDKKLKTELFSKEIDCLLLKYIYRVIPLDLVFYIQLYPERSEFDITIKIYTFELIECNIALRHEFKIPEIMSNESPMDVILRDIHKMKDKFKALFKSE